MVSESWRDDEDDVPRSVIPIRGAAAPIVENMEQSLTVPTATDIERIAALEERMARAEGALVRLGLKRCQMCSLWLPYQALAPGEGCHPTHEGLLQREAW